MEAAGAAAGVVAVGEGVALGAGAVGVVGVLAGASSVRVLSARGASEFGPDVGVAGGRAGMNTNAAAAAKSATIRAQTIFIHSPWSQTLPSAPETPEARAGGEFIRSAGGSSQRWCGTP